MLNHVHINLGRNCWKEMVAIGPRLPPSPIPYPIVPFQQPPPPPPPLPFIHHTVFIYLVVPVDAEHVDDDKGDEDKEGGEDGLQVSVVLVAQQGCQCPAHRISALNFKFLLTDCG